MRQYISNDKRAGQRVDGNDDPMREDDVQGGERGNNDDDNAPPPSEQQHPMSAAGATPMDTSLPGKSHGDDSNSASLRFDITELQVWVESTRPLGEDYNFNHPPLN